VKLFFQVDAALEGKRLDRALVELEPSFSRAQLQRWIEMGAIRVSGQVVKSSHRLRAGDAIAGETPEPVPDDRIEPEAIPLHVTYEDGQLIVVDKPPGLVVHPSAGHRTGTLVHALMYHCRGLSGVGGVLRPGIVHRLDKGTSGLLVAAKSDRAHRHLAAQFKAHSVEREYLALVRGEPGAEHGSIDAPIGRHPSDRKRLSTRARRGRPAVTHWRVDVRYRGLTLLRVRLETGRTHQIRVHLASVGMPVAGDPVYGGGKRVTHSLGLERQALHAARLGFEHPVSGERLSFESPLPADLRDAIEGLEA
jgi:23S rRNA pseudouridine1911/1915/1917 synthase